MIDSYKTILTRSEGEFKDKGSKFLAYAFPITNEEDIENNLVLIRKEHPKARHHCYAWKMGLDDNQYRANDDGEPSGTAGRPILGQIISYGLTNVIVIVVRYFGGTLLGTSGLIQAYKESTADALSKATIIEKIVEDIISISFDYAMMSDVMNALKKLQINILNQTFTDNGLIQVAIRKSETAHTLLQFRALIKKISIEEAILSEEIEGVVIHDF